ncbi:hypothetical protein OHR68_14415 [Spirillospora sp. NBC_00431]
MVTTATGDLIITLAGTSAAVGIARTLAHTRLSKWDYSHILDDSLVVVSELVTNAGAPRGVPSYPRYSREELKGGSWA